MSCKRNIRRIRVLLPAWSFRMNKILSSYKKAFLHVAHFFLLCISCVIASFVFTFPLFCLADSHKGIYTFLCSFFILLLFVFLVIRQMIRSYKTSPRRLFLFIFKTSYIIIFITFFAFLTIRFYKTLAIALLIASFILYIIIFPPLTKWSEN